MTAISCRARCHRGGDAVAASVQLKDVRVAATRTAAALIEIQCIAFTTKGARKMAATTMVHVRVDEHIKNQATETLASMGLTVSDAVRVFLTRVVTDQQLPFPVQAPNASTRAAMREARTIAKARFGSAGALIHDLEKGAKR